MTWSLVKLPQIYVIDLQAVPFQEPRNRDDWADAHLIGFNARGDEATEDAEGLQPLLRGQCIAHDHARGRAVRKLARVTGGDGLTFEYRLDLGEALRRGIGTRSFVLRKGNAPQGSLFGLFVDD